MVPTIGPAVSTKEPFSHLYTNQLLKSSSLWVPVGRTAVDVLTELATAFHHLLFYCDGKVSQDDGFPFSDACNPHHTTEQFEQL